MTPAQARAKAEATLNYRIPVSVLILAGLCAFSISANVRQFRAATADLLREANDITASAVRKL